MEDKDKKIEELEKKRKELIEKFQKIIFQPITKESIEEAKTTGVEVLSQLIDNDIVSDIMNWDNDSKLSETALKWKKSLKDKL